MPLASVVSRIRWAAHLKSSCQRSNAFSVKAMAATICIPWMITLAVGILGRRGWAQPHVLFPWLGGLNQWTQPPKNDWCVPAWFHKCGLVWTVHYFG